MQRLPHGNPVVVVVGRNTRQCSSKLDGIEVAGLLCAHFWQRCFFIRRVRWNSEWSGIGVDVDIRIIAYKTEGIEEFDLFVFTDVEVRIGFLQTTQHHMPGMFVGVGVRNAFGGNTDFDPSPRGEINAKTVAGLDARRCLRAGASGDMIKVVVHAPGGADRASHSTARLWRGSGAHSTA